MNKIIEVSGCNFYIGDVGVEFVYFLILNLVFFIVVDCIYVVN